MNHVLTPCKLLLLEARNSIGSKNKRHKATTLPLAPLFTDFIVCSAGLPLLTLCRTSVIYEIQCEGSGKKDWFEGKIIPVLVLILVVESECPL